MNIVAVKAVIAAVGSFVILWVAAWGIAAITAYAALTRPTEPSVPVRYLPMEIVCWYPDGPVYAMAEDDCPSGVLAVERI